MNYPYPTGYMNKTRFTRNEDWDVIDLLDNNRVVLPVADYYDAQFHNVYPVSSALQILLYWFNLEEHYYIGEIHNYCCE